MEAKNDLDKAIRKFIQHNLERKLESKERNWSGALDNIRL